MPGLTPDDIIDLSRWHAIQFRDRATAEAATERYRLYRQRLREEHEAQQPPLGSDSPGMQAGS